MPLCPWADYLPIPSSITGVPIPMQSYLGVVEHVTEGNGSPYPWFCNPAAQAFSHFFIGIDGTLQQFMSTEYQSWAQEQGNATYLSCETEGFSTGYLTGPQVQTFGRLLAWLWNEHQMPQLVVTDTVGQEGLILHSDGGAAWGGHPCPGPLRAAQRPQILAIAAALVMGVPKPPPPQPSKEDLVNIIFADAKYVCIGVSPEGHPLVFASAQPQGPWEVCDVTDEIHARVPGANYTVTA